MMLGENTFKPDIGGRYAQADNFVVVLLLLWDMNDFDGGRGIS